MYEEYLKYIISFIVTPTETLFIPSPVAFDRLHDDTMRRKILMGEIFTNLMNFQQFVNIFPIKIFHLLSYFPLMNLWLSGSTGNKIVSEVPSLENHNIQSSLSHYTVIFNGHTLSMTINSFHDSQFHALVNHHTSTLGKQSMHVPRCDITCPLPCSCGYPKKVWLIYVYINYN